MFQETTDNERPRFEAPASEDFSGLPFRLRVLFQVLKHIQWGSLTITVPDGRSFNFHGTQPGLCGNMHIHSYEVLSKLHRQGTLGAGESYFEGHWESPDVTTFLEVIARNEDAFEDIFGSGKLLRPLQRIYHYFKRNTKEGAKKNIMAHYDLGNDFYSHWLDPSMTYSSALFHDYTQSLMDAQINKYRALAAALDIQPHHKVLEIGCGWGGFAEYVARTIGCEITGLTISPEQYKFASERMKRHNLQDKVSIRLEDYRDCKGDYDCIVSIEMIEAVGMQYWPTYFRTIHQRLKPGGRAGIQAITIEEKSFQAYSKKLDYIQRYIFPGGMLPAISILQEVTRAAGLNWQSDIAFGKDYAETLRRWHKRFLDAWPDINQHGFDHRFKLLWTYYFAYCEAGFRAGTIDVHQITLQKA